MPIFLNNKLRSSIFFFPMVQVTTDHEIVTTEILKHRNVGRYLHLTQYFQRQVLVLVLT